MEKITPITKEQAFGIIFGNKFEVFYNDPSNEEFEIATEESDCENAGSLLLTYKRDGWGEVLASKEQLDTCQWQLVNEDGIDSEYDKKCLLELVDKKARFNPIVCRLEVVIKYIPTTAQEVISFIRG